MINFLQKRRFNDTNRRERSESPPFVPFVDEAATAQSSFTPPLVLVAFIFPALAGYNFGYDIGSTSGAIQRLRHVPSAAALDGSPLLQGLLTSGSLFGTCVGTALSFLVAAPLGRRGELLLAATLYLLGTAICTLAPDGTYLLHAVFAGRGAYGLGVAFAMHAAPVYISEVTPPSIRGVLVSLKEAMIVVGILSGFSASALTTAYAVPFAISWRLIWLPPALIALIVFIGMLYAPPSPRWLLLRAASLQERDPSKALRYGEEAARGLRRLRSRTLCGDPVCDDRAVEEELQSIRSMLGSGGSNSTRRKKNGNGSGGEGGGEASCGEVLSARRALIAGLGLVLLQQVTGQPSVLYYQESIFRDAGFGSLAAYASVIVGGAKLLATMFTVLRVDHYGRRPLLFAGISLMLVSLITLSIAFYTRDSTSSSSSEDGNADASSDLASILIVIALMVYVCGYQIGFGPIAWLMISEVFPLRTRGTALSIAVTVNFGFNLLVTFTLPSIQQAFDSFAPGRGMSYLFALYAGFCVASIAFTHACVPETKGKTLEEIERELRD